MEVRFVMKNVDVPAQLKEYMERKMSKMEKFFARLENNQIVVKHLRDDYVVELTAYVSGVIMRGEETDSDLRKAFDLALKNLERRIRRHKEYLVDRVHMKSRDVNFDELEEHQPVADEPTVNGKIVREKHFEMSSMTQTEAAAQMDLLGHSFYVFLNAESGKMNVVYRRNAGDYGVLIPD